jgi:hypothetical protein
MSLGRRASRPSGFPMSKAPLLCTSEPVRGRVLPPTGLAVRLPQPLFSDGSLVDVDEDFSGKCSSLHLVVSVVYLLFMLCSVLPEFVDE